MTRFFYVTETQYANGPEEMAYLVVDSSINIIVHTTVSKEYANELVQLLNAGRITVKGNE